MEAHWTGYLLIKSPRMNNFQILCEIFAGSNFCDFSVIQKSKFPQIFFVQKFTLI